MEAIKGSKFPIGQLSVASKACLCLLRLIYTIFRKFIPFSTKLFHFARYYSILRDIIPFCASLFHFARVYSILHRVIPFHTKLFQFARYYSILCQIISSYSLSAYPNPRQSIIVIGRNTDGAVICCALLLNL